MTNQHSTTGEPTHREKLLAKALGDVLVAAGVMRQASATGPELLHMAESYVLSRPSRMAASSEGEPVEIVGRLIFDLSEDGRIEIEDNRVVAVSGSACEEIVEACLAARPDAGRGVGGLNWETIADERGKIAADLGARLVLARMAIENAVDALRNRGRFGSPDDALANLSDTLAALRSGSTPPVAARASTVHQPSYDAGYAQGAFDEAQEGAVAVPVSEERVVDIKAQYPDLWAILLDVYTALPDEHAALSDKLIYALQDALAVPDKGVQGDQGASGGLGQPGSGSQPEADVGATAALAGDLTAPYKPVAVHFELSDTLQYVARDEPTYSEPVTTGLDALKTLDGEPVGWCIYGWSKIAPAMNMGDVGRYLLGTALQGSVGFEHHGRRAVLVARYADAAETAPATATLANDTGPNTVEVGKPMPYFCPACQAIPRAGFCRLAGCPTAPTSTVRGE